MSLSSLKSLPKAQGSLDYPLKQTLPEPTHQQLRYGIDDTLKRRAPRVDVTPRMPPPHYMHTPADWLLRDKVFRENTPPFLEKTPELEREKASEYLVNILHDTRNFTNTWHLAHIPAAAADHIFEKLKDVPNLRVDFNKVPYKWWPAVTETLKKLSTPDMDRPTLKTLDIRMPSLPEEFDKMLDFLSKPQNALIELQYDMRNITPSQQSKLFNKLKNQPQLKTLRGINSDATPELIEGLKSLKNLEDLSIGFYTPDSQARPQYTGTHRSVQSLKLEMFKDFVAERSALAGLTDPNANIILSLSGNFKMGSIDIPEEMLMIAPSAARPTLPNDTLQTAPTNEGPSSSSEDSDDASVQSAALAYVQAIFGLESDEPLIIDNSRVQVTAEHSSPIAGTDTAGVRLGQASTSAQKILHESLLDTIVNLPLRHLTLNCSDLGNEGSARMAPLLKRLHSLDLTGTDVGHEGMQTFTNELVKAHTEGEKPPMEKLTLTAHKVHGENAAPLANFLQHLPNLKELNLRGMWMIDKDWHDVTPAIKGLENLERLNVEGNDVPKEIMRELQAGAADVKSSSAQENLELLFPW